MNINKSNIIRLFSFILFLAGTTTTLKAQNNTSSPYSMFGIGTTDLIGNGRSAAMGGTGIAIRSSEFINLANPASYTALDSMRFYYDIGAHGGYTYAESNQESDGLVHGNFTALSLATRVTDRWYLGFGLTPKSSIGYNITTTKAIEGTNSTYPTYWSGDGGITQVFLNNGVKITEDLSVGVGGSFLFGPLSSTKQIIFATPSSTEYTTFQNDIYYAGVQATFATQYTRSFEGVGTFTLGLTYDLEVDLTGEEDELIVHSSSQNGYLDTLFFGTNDRASVTIPEAFGVGVSYLNPKENLTLTADYRLYKWDGTDDDFNYRDQHIFSLGAEYIRSRMSRRYRDRIAYRVGGRYDTGYLTFTGGEKIPDYRVSCGVGLPVQRGGSYINLALEAGQRGTTNQRLIREQYIQGTVSFSLSQFWYGSAKYD